MTEDIEQVCAELKKFRQDNPYLGNKSKEVLAFRARLGLPNGVTYVPHRRKDCAASKLDERLFNGESTYIECAAFYQVRLRLLSKTRMLGSPKIMRNAAKLYDSALFHLWSYCDRPSAKKFNLFKPGDAAPELLLSVKELREKLFRECGADCLDYYTANPQTKPCP